MQLCLWGNRFDLSLHSIEQIKQIANESSKAPSADAVEQSVASLEEFVVIDESDRLMEYLWRRRSAASSECSSATRAASEAEGLAVGLVVDNAGYEFVTDLVLALFLSSSGLARHVRFYVKAMPWFVSDVTARDVHATLDELRAGLPDSTAEGRELSRQFAEACEAHFSDGRWSVEVRDYWSTPLGYEEMPAVDPALYAELSREDLLIFKGDYHYRKLLNDRNWMPEAATGDAAHPKWGHPLNTWERALGPFRPTALVAVRAMKSDLIAGVPQDRFDWLTERDKEWLVNGKFGQLQVFLPPAHE